MQALRFTAFAAATLVATPSLADRALTSDTGVVYAEMAGDSACRLVTGNETILLTESCAAQIPGRGRGSWSWTDRGTTVTVGTYSVSFAGDVPLLPLYRCMG